MDDQNNPAIKKPIYRPKRAITYQLLAVMLFTASDLMSKYLGKIYPIGEVIFFRALFGLIPALFLASRGVGFVRNLKTRRYGLHFLRCVLGTTVSVLFIFSFQKMKYADVIALSFTAPLFITMLSSPILGEKVGVPRLLAIIVGFFGVLVVFPPWALLRPDLLPWISIMLFASVAYAGAIIVLRLMGRTETNIASTTYFYIFMTILTGISCFFAWRTPDSWLDVTLFVVFGICSGLGQLLLAQALRLAPATVVSPFDYSYLLWGAIFGLIIFGESISASTMMGGSIMAISGLFILWYEAGRPLPPLIADKFPRLKIDRGG